jgi:CRISPR-associated protein Cas1
MIKKIVEVSSGPTRLSVAHRQLVVAREEHPPASVACEDIGVLIVDNPAVSYTHGVFTALLDHGAAVVLCGGDHHPAGLLMPLAGNAVQNERYRAQIEAPVPLKKRLWQALVETKLRQQGAVLAWATGKDMGLSAIAERVRSGDPDNLEGQGAQRYWPNLLGSGFRRHREGRPPNNWLNYGYMVLRAGMARALVGSGLMPTLGIHHHNRYNAFCLADDAMEPYRPFVDWRVVGLLRERGGPSADLDREAKRSILSLFQETVLVGGRRAPLMLALQSTAASLAESFANGDAALALPKGLPLAGADAPREGADDDEGDPGS